MYSRNQLLALRTAQVSVAHQIPREIKAEPRGCRSGKRRREKRLEGKRRYKPAVPTVIMGNVNSLTNKVDELSSLVRNIKLYKECSLMCFSETWLNGNIPDENVALPGFTVIRSDRNARTCGKKKGGGLAVYINARWCNPGHITTKITICERDIELIAISMRPYYLPRELANVIAVNVYVPPRADATVACDVINDAVARLQTQHPEALVLIAGDFNHVTLETTLPAFSQYVDCYTRGNKTIDLMYANIKEAYSASPLPALGKADHNLVLLQPSYKARVRMYPITTRSFRKWTPEAEMALRDCFRTTDWDVLQGGQCGGIDEVTNCTTDYINFCMDAVVPVKTVKCYPNNKPWITSHIKGLLNMKKRAFKDGDQWELKRAQKELRVQLRAAKEQYRRKLEQKLQKRSMKEVWDGMKIITGCGAKRGASIIGDVEKANQLNNFFNRFDETISNASQNIQIGLSLSSSYLLNSSHDKNHKEENVPTPLITAAQVSGQLRRICSRKAAGPDGVPPRLLKACAAELGEPLQRIFNMSLEQRKVPIQWKTSCIVPVPKRPQPKEMNDYRPVALTSHVMKTLERLIIQILKPQTSHARDPLQFAYQEKVGVEDAITYLLHKSLSHLDRGCSVVRITFLDFSSAFNTIQPRILRHKLREMGVNSQMVAWINDYLTERPQFVRLGDCRSDTVVSNTGAPQGTVLSPVLFTLYTSDFQYTSEYCHVQKYADDTAIVGCVRKGQEDEYRKLIQDFVVWCSANYLRLNVAKTKEMVVDFRKSTPNTEPVIINGERVEQVKTYKYLGVQLDEKLDWTANTDALCRKAQCRMYFLRRLASFNVCKDMLRMFYRSVVESALFFVVACWGSSIKKRDELRINKMVRKASTVVGTELESMTSVAESRALSRIRTIMENSQHPLHSTIQGQRSSFSRRLLSLQCSTDRLKRSLIHNAIRLYNSDIRGS